MKCRLVKNAKLKMLIASIENTFAYALPVFFQQFIVYPLMAKKMGAEAYGYFLAIIALNYLVINITAAALVNVRLLKSKQYEEQGVIGDFNLFLLIFSIVNTLTIICGSIFYAGAEVSFIDLSLSAIVGLLFLFHDYIIVQYRIELRFHNILVNNLLLCAGYLLGLAGLYFVFPCWQIVFIVPYTMTAIYDLRHTTYIKEPLRKTPLFRETAKKYVLLLGSTLLGSFVTYGDRLILYPLMDGTSVSVFSSAQLIGKSLQMISTPLASFLLAHLVKRQMENITIKRYYLILAVGACSVLYLGCIMVGRPIIRMLYPEWAEQSLQYVPLTVINSVLRMVIVLLNVVVLRFCSARWQIIKNAVYLCFYMLFCFTLLKSFGLRGFCVGNIIASAAEMILLVVVLVKEKVVVMTGKYRNGT